MLGERVCHSGVSWRAWRRTAGSTRSCRPSPTLTREQLRDAVAYAASSALRSLPFSDRAGLDTDEIDAGKGE